MLIYVVTSNKLYKGLSGVHGVFTTRQLAQEYVDQCSRFERRVIFERRIDDLVKSKANVSQLQCGVTSHVPGCPMYLADIQ